MRLIHFTLILMLPMTVLAQWTHITGNLPSGYSNDSSSLLGGTYISSDGSRYVSNIPSPAVQRLLSYGSTLMVQTLASIYVSNDQGESFNETQMPFSFQNSTRDINHRRIWLFDGKFHILERVFKDPSWLSALYTYSPETNEWIEEIVFFDDLNTSTFGNVSFYFYDSDSSTHYAITQFVDYFTITDPFTTSIFGYLWKSADGAEWERLTPEGEKLERTFQVLVESGVIYLRTTSGILASYNEGDSFEQIANLSDGFESVTRRNFGDPLYSREQAPLTVIEDGHDDFFALGYSRRMSVHPDLGIGAAFRIIDPTTLEEVNGWLPMELEGIVKHDSAYFTFGNPFEPEGTDPKSSQLAFFSSTQGLTWEEINLDGIEDIPLDNPESDEGFDPSAPFLPGGGGFVLIPPIDPVPTLIESATAMTFDSEYAYLVTDQSRLWRRPLSELNFEPATQILNPPKSHRVAIGETTNLEVSAVGSGELTYQWFKDETIMEGETASQLTLANIQTTDLGFYRVEVTAGKGTVMSEAAELTQGASYNAFAQANFPSASRAPQMDSNGNGVSNLEEYLFGATDPSDLKQFSIDRAADLGLHASDDERFFTLTYRKRISATGYNIKARAATTLGELSENDARPIGTPVIDGEFEVHTVRTRFSFEDNPQGFLQLMIEEN